jgi:hypothetical protein
LVVVGCVVSRVVLCLYRGVVPAILAIDTHLRMYSKKKYLYLKANKKAYVVAYPDVPHRVGFFSFIYGIEITSVYVSIYNTVT